MSGALLPLLAVPAQLLAPGLLRLLGHDGGHVGDDLVHVTHRLGAALAEHEPLTLLQELWVLDKPAADIRDKLGQSVKYLRSEKWHETSLHRNKLFEVGSLAV